MQTKKLDDNYIETIYKYLQENRSSLGNPYKTNNKLTKENTIYGNEHGRFAMTDGNSLYILNRGLDEVKRTEAIPGNAIESDKLFDLYSELHISSGPDYYSSRIKAIDPIVEQAKEEGFLTDELLDSLNILPKDYIYTLRLDVFRKSNILYFTREQIDFYRKLIGTDTTDYHSWTSKMLYGKSEKGQAYVYTKKDKYF